MERRREKSRLAAVRMRSCEGTDSNVRRDSQLYVTMVLSNCNGFCVPPSEMGGLVGSATDWIPVTRARARWSPNTL